MCICPFRFIDITQSTSSCYTFCRLVSNYSKESIKTSIESFHLLIGLSLVSTVPVAVVADNITATSMTVSWQPPHNANGIIKSYQVSYTPEDESECIQDIAGDITSTELTSLKPYTEYTICVRAKTQEFGEYSISITATTDSE